MIETAHNAAVRCQAVCDMLSRVQRPYLFLVTVRGQFPHAYTRKYHIAADTDSHAAMKGIETFVKEFSAPVIAMDMATMAPKAKLQ